MKVFVAGATGVISRLLVPMLITAGHEVVGTTRTRENAQWLREQGVTPCIINVFERDTLIQTIKDIRPDVIIHQLTDLKSRDLAANARLRIEGTRNLVDAAKAAGVRRMIAQSISWIYEPGEGPANEEVGYDREAPEPRSGTVAGIEALEAAVAEIETGISLRYGLLYGPGTWYAPNGSVTAQVREGKVVADRGVTSFLHVEDAAQAALEALSWPAGIYNIVDDLPAPATDWLPFYAQLFDAPAPPTSDDRPRGARGASNVRARQQLGWVPRYPNWHEGFASMV